jgi:restriction system protein
VASKRRTRTALTQTELALSQRDRDAERARQTHARQEVSRARPETQKRAAAERDAKRRYIQRRKDEAIAKTRALEDDVAALERLLLNGLRHDPYLELESLKEPPRLARFDPGADGSPLPPPDPTQFLPRRPGKIALMVPGADRRYERDLKAARERFEAAVAEHSQREAERRTRLRVLKADHELATEAMKRRVAEQHATIEALKTGLEAGQARADREY